MSLPAPDRFEVWRPVGQLGPSGSQQLLLLGVTIEPAPSRAPLGELTRRRTRVLDRWGVG